MSEVYAGDTHTECARYAYDKAGRRVAFVSNEIGRLATQYGWDGRRSFLICEPMKSSEAFYEISEQTSFETIAVEPMEWRDAGNYARAWTIRFFDDADVAKYLRWYPDFALSQEGDAE